MPTNLMMRFLGAGKTTAILDLFKQKPKNENWEVLVNKFYNRINVINIQQVIENVVADLKIYILSTEHE